MADDRLVIRVRGSVLSSLVLAIILLTASLLPVTEAQAAPIGFGLSVVANTSGSKPTTLAWGPDGRLYVGYVRRDDPRVHGEAERGEQLRGDRHARRSTRSQASRTTTTTATSSAPTAGSSLGLVVTGSASQPVIYASSSDPRIGGGSEGSDLNLDTNSGTLSRLTWNGSSWNHTLLVRGLPRSEENHGPNGIALSANGSTLYWAYGGHTNKGGPSFKFAGLPEYAYSAAILIVNLTAIGNSTYDLPTLNDPSRADSGGQDVRDPFGGNDGANQAKITSASPVQVFASGFRNPYDLAIATVGSHAGKIVRAR